MPDPHALRMPNASSEPVRLPLDPAPTRVIEVGGVTAGIAVPEGRGVRFFSSSRTFDSLDGLVFQNIEQAARAARARTGRARLRTA